MNNKIIEFIETSNNVGRKESFIHLMNKIFDRWGSNPINIVETGTTRKSKHEDVKPDGGSTIVWGYWASLTNSKVWTCDIDENNINNCKYWTEDYKQYISYHTEDSISFLKNFNYQIDFLYLDSYDTSGDNPEIIHNACLHQLNEIKNVSDKLKEDSLILLDDVRNDLKGGKSEYSISWMLENNWKIINHDKKNQQVILSKI